MEGSNSKQWVLLAAGSKGWENYRHQADVCHAYQVVHQSGIPDEQIVVMMYDDIAYNEENPFRGNIINVPDGPNVYSGVPKDYTGKDVTADNFLAVLRGDSSAINTTGSKKVIQSGENDTIFIYLSDHGSHGVFRFPESTLYSHDLITTVKQMSENQKFAKMLIFIEACHSGSMLEELPKLGNVYAIAACKPDESSYACFLDEKRNACLADVFTAHWLHFTKTETLNSATFENLFYHVKEKVINAIKKYRASQTPCQYGDKAMLQEPLGKFFGECPSDARENYKSQCRSFEVTQVINNEDVPLLIQENRIKNEWNPQKREALKRKHAELKRKREAMAMAVQRIARQSRASGARTDQQKMTRMYKLKVVEEHFRMTFFNWHEDPFVFTQSHRQVLVDLCETGLGIQRITAVISEVRREMTI